MKRTILVAALGIVQAASSFGATTFSASGTLGGLAVDGTADFTIGANSISVVLTNNISNPTSAGQLLSGLDFTLSDSVTGAITGLVTGATVTVASDGSFTTGGVQALPWNFSNNSGVFFFTALNAQPDFTVIGTSSDGNYTSGTYSNANNSIAGNASHNPFAQNGTTLLLGGIVGLTDQTTISSVTFHFGTATLTLPGTTDGGGGGGAEVPEPATLGLLGAALVGLGLARRKFSKV